MEESLSLSVVAVLTERTGISGTQQIRTVKRDRKSVKATVSGPVSGGSLTPRASPRATAGPSQFTFSFDDVYDNVVGLNSAMPWCGASVKGGRSFAGELC